MAKVWVLTNEVNAFDQCGEYFVTFFTDKPSAEQLKAILTKLNYFRRNFSDIDDVIADLLDNGGNRGWDWNNTECYYLRQYEEGQI